MILVLIGLVLLFIGLLGLFLHYAAEVVDALNGWLNGD